ncbi:MAG: hypothetical protein AB8G86_17550, partial [Saprospiraceae bacterium]
WFFAREEYELRIDLGGCPMTAINDTTETLVNTPVDISVLVNDLGTEEIDTTSMEIGISALNGTANVDTILWMADYTPVSGFVGLDSFTYVFCYGVYPVKSLCDSAMVFINVIPLPEDCMNNMDDDGDGLIDCKDPDCQLVAPNIQRMKQGYLDWAILCLIAFLLYSLIQKGFIGQLIRKQPLEIK